MKIELRFFAAVREALQVTQESVELPADIYTVGAVRDWLRARGGIWSEVLGQPSVRMAYDHVMTEPETAIAEGGEVAFFPPVTGG
ncbi:molybdopterin converting factor subunit 1 [Herbaspirillum sp. RTI4]|uniref:molybdopterin converting factor subunit 1 n=1 Tax=Herbaspirillum sp. RTI4 TaxID=3048640 RepID=UPI002AB528F5|nr:molybdopterin converting factor subunit 1 [Herbaspirillum sp. RTI4]MDY7578385.1 molybdopterin converting factor subunit 1 [Herbaspirillum sp. RTI4]MEA9983074.1 molybdopterin converting factor subunit 1 [Herbaspirillum sp. RTI4]